MIKHWANVGYFDHTCLPLLASKICQCIPFGSGVSFKHFILIDDLTYGLRWNQVVQYIIFLELIPFSR